MYFLEFDFLKEALLINLEKNILKKQILKKN